MKTYLQTILCLIFAASFSANGLTMKRSTEEIRDGAAPPAATGLAQVKLLRISATVDGSGRFIFDRSNIRYEHKHWDPPTNMTFDGAPWTELSQTPAAWRELGRQLDLTKAWIVERKGRDMIALEHTADGFDLYLCDSPNGAGEYAVTIAIPRRNGAPPQAADPESDR